MAFHFKYQISDVQAEVPLVSYVKVCTYKTRLIDFGKKTSVESSILSEGKKESTFGGNLNGKKVMGD